MYQQGIGGLIGLANSTSASLALLSCIPRPLPYSFSILILLTLHILYQPILNNNLFATYGHYTSTTSTLSPCTRILCHRMHLVSQPEPCNDNVPRCTKETGYTSPLALLLSAPLNTVVQTPAGRPLRRAMLSRSPGFQPHVHPISALVLTGLIANSLRPPHPPDGHRRPSFPAHPWLPPGLGVGPTSTSVPSAPIPPTSSPFSRVPASSACATRRDRAFAGRVRPQRTGGIHRCY